MCVIIIMFDYINQCLHNSTSHCIMHLLLSRIMQHLMGQCAHAPINLEFWFGLAVTLSMFCPRLFFSLIRGGNHLATWSYQVEEWHKVAERTVKPKNIKVTVTPTWSWPQPSRRRSQPNEEPLKLSGALNQSPRTSRWG